MKGPRVSIRTLMAVVVVAAIDCGALKTFRPPVFDPDFSDLVVFGALPMASVVAIGAAPSLGAGGVRPRGRPFLVGLEAFGAAAVVFFLALAAVATRPLHDKVGQALRPLGPGKPAFLAAATAVLMLPQLALALVGG